MMTTTHDDGAAVHAPRRAPRWRSKGYVVMLTVALAIVAFATTTQTWLEVGVEGRTVKTPDVTVAGSDAATAVTALALVALAGALAVSIAGRIARVIIVVLIFGAGIGIAAASAAVLIDPQSAASASIAEAVGVIGGDPHIEISTPPVVALVAGVLLALSAVYTLIAARSWASTSSSRFEKPAAAAGRYETAADDAGSDDVGFDGVAGRGATGGDIAATGDGRVGSAGVGDGVAGNGDSDSGAGDDGAGEDFDEIDGWDRLSRGQDPTA